MAKSLERIKARKLRKLGWSIKSIAKELEVSSGSVSIWCRDIELTKEQIERLERNSRDPYYGRRLEYVVRIKKQTDEKIIRLKEEGIKEVGELSKRELFLVGIALYWAEGYKKDSQVGFGSSDVEMIKLFIRWLKECFGYELEDLRFRVTINISHKYRIDDIQDYWSKELGISKSSFQKPFYQRTKWKK